MNSQDKLEYDGLRYQLAAALDEAANAHDAGNMPAIESGFDEIDQILPRTVEPRYNKLFVALNFWDGWIDARNHEWLYYQGISQEDWSALARQVAQAMRDDLEIGDECVLHHFDLQKPPGKSVFTCLCYHLHKRSYY